MNKQRTPAVIAILIFTAHAIFGLLLMIAGLDGWNAFFIPLITIFDICFVIFIIRVEWFTQGGS